MFVREQLLPNIIRDNEIVRWNWWIIYHFSMGIIQDETV